jgi:hypothetical protein
MISGELLYFKKFKKKENNKGKNVIKCKKL